MVNQLEQCLGSAVRYIQDNVDGEPTLYFDDIPEKFMVPSIYFPVPRTTGRRVTFETYLNTIYFEAWFMASTDWLAYSAASDMRDCIMLDNCNIRCVNADGTFAKRAYRISEPEIIPIATGIVKLAFSIRDYFSAYKDMPIKATNINISGTIKSAVLYEAWLNATQKQRTN